MVGKSTTVSKFEVGNPIRRLNDQDVLPLNEAIMVFLGLAVSRRISRIGDSDLS
jgi:mRNA interferase MazF